MIAGGETLRHGCKINLFLRIGRRLDNGYHTLESLFTPLPMPADRLVVHSAREGLRTRFFAAGETPTPLPDIDPTRNSLTKAYALYAEAAGFAPGLSIDAHKGIPAGGGLGGGSANAAALLLYLQDRAARSGREPLTAAALAALAKKVGADVPFFLLRDQSAWVTGIGDELRPVPNPLAGRFVLVACPKLTVPTAWAYAALDAWREQGESAGNDTKSGDIQATCQENELFRNQDLTSAGHQASYSLPDWRERGNDFEPIVFARYPELARLKERLQALGARPARMSGTGACVFGVFEEEAGAEKASKILAQSDVSVYISRL